MTMPRERLGSWETAGTATTDSHPFDPAALRAHVPPGARVLDHGCGRGGRVAALAALGYAAEGADGSRELVEAGRRAHPGLPLTHCPELPLPFEDGRYAAALLFGVLSRVPDDAGQRAVLGELARVVRPGGLLHLSDAPLQTDPRARARYAAYEDEFGAYGVFRTEDGTVVRHHEPEHLRRLLRMHGFAVAEERTDAVGTLHGHPVRRVQLIARRETA
ncbi:class I SAM-dependent methyltransferase [Streptomyces sp. Ru73]|uniref:class I SAM-dependent methyltransferase n=1 Tax=Streptomyces sp. Ru73 TaxID=2080748 RepID=UPI000CDDD559|nr:class I SAM-dependent methyltransferase [Streptomyces sp. Ru73]POX39618.1 class I SAM-dependent methyltransferase [Streptomyces sp. Ru73]